MVARLSMKNGEHLVIDDSDIDDNKMLCELIGTAIKESNGFLQLTVYADVTEKAESHEAIINVNEISSIV